MSPPQGRFHRAYLPATGNGNRPAATSVLHGHSIHLCYVARRQGTLDGRVCSPPGSRYTDQSTQQLPQSPVYRFTKNHVVLGASVVLLAALTLGVLTRPRWEPLSPALPPSGETVLPVCVVDAASASMVSSPFQLVSELNSTAGSILALAEGEGSTGATGRARLPFALEATAVYHAWARVRWTDSCGNSLGFQIDSADENVIGQDAVFGTWHWVSAGAFQIATGKHTMTFREREDGEALDQGLLSTDPTFVPSAPVRSTATGVDIRRFADSFNRSPGHGLKHWNAHSGDWQVAFTMDPNRMPNQYSLVGQPGTSRSPASLSLGGPPWSGCRVEWSVFPEEGSQFGLQFTPASPGPASSSELRFTVTQPRSQLVTTGPSGPREAVPVPVLASGQWSRITVERWAWVLRVLVDGSPVTLTTGLPPTLANIAFHVTRGKVYFDDATVDEILWQAEGDGLRAPWNPGKDATWFRPATSNTGVALRGVRGTISAALADIPVLAVLLEERSPGGFRLSGDGWAPAQTMGIAKLLTRSTPDPTPIRQVVITPTRPDARLSRVAIAYGLPLENTFRIGPHDFAEDTIPDPSDYLDFTPEEYRAISDSKQADKLMRSAKTIAVLGEKEDYCVWKVRNPSWEVSEGILRGMGPGAELRFWQELSCSLTFKAKILLRTPRTSVGLSFCHGQRGGAGVTFAGRAVPRSATPPKASQTIVLSETAAWHDIEVKVTPTSISSRLAGNEWRQHAVRDTWGGELRLQVHAGTAEFDDIEVLVPRRTAEQRFYAFDRRETDWLRTGGRWIDHGGISCALASNWISLVADAEKGVLWNKLAWSDNLLVAFNIEENSEWFGWEQEPSHEHHAFDNICVTLTPSQDWHKGYRLEVNAEDRTATVLYRNGKEVCRTAQGASFPIQFVGGHAPYRPRRNRIRLVKDGDYLEATVNGIPILTYRDPAPLTVRRVGLGGYRTGVNFSRIVVRKLLSSDAQADTEPPKSLLARPKPIEKDE